MDEFNWIKYDGKVTVPVYIHCSKKCSERDPRHGKKKGRKNGRRTTVLSSFSTAHDYRVT